MRFSPVRVKNESQFVSVPAPVGGLNVYDSLAAMPPTDAIRLNNLVPQSYGCTVRKGYIAHSTGMTGPVHTVSTWNDNRGVAHIYSFSVSAMYDATNPGTAGLALVTGLTNDWWQEVNFANASGSHLVAFNGVDNPIWVSGAGVQRLTAGSGTDPGTWSGVDPKNLIQGTIHQRRIWAVQVDTTLGWYLPADAVYGVASFFDFGPFFKLGGYLALLVTWTADAGSGSRDHLVAISSEGEAAVFAGLDVASANAWSLVGVYFVGTPVRGRRFATNMAGDLMLLTMTGVVSMATVLTSTQVNVSNNNAYSKKIQFLISELTSTLSDMDGWEIHFFPAINLIYINVPSVYAGGNGQLVVNTINGAWSTFSNMNAQCWASVEGLPYFGGDNGTVYRSWYGDLDKVNVDGTGGEQIQSFAQQAYSYMGKPALQKQVGMFRPNFIGVGKIAYSSHIHYDFSAGEISPPAPGSSPSSLSLWSQALWGEGTWSGGVVTQREWQQGQGIGDAVSISLTTLTGQETTWVSTDYTFRYGGPL